MYHNEALDLWKKFEISFISSICEFNSEKTLAIELKDKSGMTAFYKQKLFPKISKELGLELLEKEYLRVDMTMYKIGGNKYHVPFVFIESENDPEGDISNEIKKLLHLNAPLKILMTRGSFADDITKNDTHWRYVIEDFAEHNRMVGFFAFISAIWNTNQFSYQYIAYSETGAALGTLQTISL